jgi:hypothetical protein
MQLMNNAFNILNVNVKFNSYMHVDNWRDVKKIINSNINVGFLILICVLINYDKCKMQLISNGFNMFKVESSIHIPCW